MNLSGWKYAVNWYNNNPLYSTTPAKFGYEFTHNNFHYINIPKENIKIGENGSIIILETKFNKTDTSKNMCGFTKTHTKSVNNIRLWYDPPKSSGILGILVSSGISSPSSRLLSAFIKASLKVLPREGTSPTDLIWGPNTLEDVGNLLKGKRGIFTAT